MSRSMGLWRGVCVAVWLFVFPCAFLCVAMFVVPESLNLGDAGDLGSRDSQTLLHIRVIWETLKRPYAQTMPQTIDIGTSHWLGP